MIMRKNDVLKALKGCLIVSCQANEGEPMNGYPLVMQAMAKAVIAGGAKGIRANTPSDIQSIRAITDLPIIGIYKQDYADSEIYITPTFKEVEEVIEAGSDIVALDGTLRKRPNGETLESIIAKTKEKYPEIAIMADVSNYEEAEACAALGFDILSSTLSGYTPYTKKNHHDPDYGLVAKMANKLNCFVIAEGKVATPEQMRTMFAIGADAVVIGGAITRPHMITKTYSDALNNL